MKLKIYLSIIALACAVTSCTSGSLGRQDGGVYVCTGGSSKRFHIDEDCKGLMRCSGNVVVMDEDEARMAGRTPCRLCCKGKKRSYAVRHERRWP